MTAKDSYLKRFPDGESRPKHCEEFFVAGYEAALLKSTGIRAELEAARAAAYCEGIMGGKLSQRLTEAHNLLLKIKKTIRHQSTADGCYGCEIASKIDDLVFPK